MTSLIACLTTGKGGWARVSELMNSMEWEKIYLITNEFGKLNFKSNKSFELIIINPDEPIDEIKSAIILQLKGKIKDLEVALNISSGSGKEHMAIISAILSSGLGLRIVEVENGKMKVV
ncbi:MAG: hypothetical protein WC758_01225 [Candidatus Woesearchaeota archaeon]|jgi:hypothetical protein